MHDVRPRPVDVMRYHGEPFLWPTTNRIEGANVELWGTYNAEATLRGRLKKEKRMIGAEAIVGGTYGKRRRGQVGPGRRRDQHVGRRGRRGGPEAGTLIG